MLTLGEATTEYVLKRLERREIRPRTGVTYAETLKLMALFVGKDTPLDEVTVDQLRGWFAELATHVQTATLHLRISTVKTFFAWWIQEEVLDRNPAWRIKLPKKPKSVPRTIPDEQVSAAFALAEDLRDEAIVALMVHCSCRAGEVAGIEMGDVDLNNRALRIVEGKGGEQRMVPIGPEAWSILSRFISERGRGSGHLIQSYSRKYAHSHDGLSPAYVSKLARDTLRRADVAESGHAYRHTFAAAMLEAGATIREVQKALGHKNISNTEIYTPFVTMKELRPYAGQKTYRLAS